MEHAWLYSENITCLKIKVLKMLPLTNYGFSAKGTQRSAVTNAGSGEIHTQMCRQECDNETETNKEAASERDRQTDRQTKRRTEKQTEMKKG